MFTRDELRFVPIFSELADKELDHLVNTSADLRLLPGEYAVHEGDSRRVLFVLLEGRVEVTKFVEGTELVVGIRKAGEVFGEVPVVFDTPFLVSFRAAEPSRVLRIEAKDFQTLAASAPQVSSEVRARAEGRVRGLQEIAAAPAPPRLTIVGPRWDRATQSLRDFLQRNSAPFDWVMPDDPSTTSVMPGPENGGNTRSYDCATARSSATRRSAKSQDRSAFTWHLPMRPTTSSSSAAGRLVLRRPFTARPRDCRRCSSSGKLRAGRPARRLSSRTISDFHSASPAVSWRIAPSSKRTGSARRLSLHASPRASTPLRVRSCSMEATSCAQER